MKKVLFITFDIKKDDYPSTPYPIATLLASLSKENVSTGYFYIDLEHAFLKKSKKEVITKTVMQKLHSNLKYFKSFDFIAISVTTWSYEYCVNLVKLLEDYNGKIILGGYEVTAMDYPSLRSDFPKADYFVKGYAEKALKNIIINDRAPINDIISEKIEYSDLKSPYIEKTIIPLSKKIHLETKRGCPYNCGFCEWGNAEKNVVDFELDRIEKEIDIIKESCVEEINILDPTFNHGKQYIDVLNLLTSIPNKKITCQARFENLFINSGKEFLNICEKYNNRIHLEFGLQTIHEGEMKIIGRKNNLEKVVDALKILNEKDISYEVSIIYAIPGQTTISFIETIEFLITNDCKNIAAYPLRVPKNSEMERKKEEYKIQTQKDEFNNVSVSESYSFNKTDRIDMDRIAERLYNREFSFDSHRAKALKSLLRIKGETEYIYEVENLKSSKAVEFIQERFLHDYIIPTQNEISKTDAAQGKKVGGERYLFMLKNDIDKFLEIIDYLDQKKHFKIRPTRPDIDKIEQPTEDGKIFFINTPHDVNRRYYCKLLLSKSGNLYITRKAKDIPVTNNKQNICKPKVFISDVLDTVKSDSPKNILYGKEVFNQLSLLKSISLEKMETLSKNVWCRDFMPVKNSLGNYVQFKYAPSYMVGKKYNKWRPDYERLHKVLSLKNVEFSDIILDGGNIEILNNTGIITDRVFRDNNTRTIEDQKKLINQIKDLLHLYKLIVIPEYPYDFTGHVDGIIRFINEDNVLINDYTVELSQNDNDKNYYRKKIIDQWYHSFINILHNEDIKITTLPYGIKEKNKSGIEEIKYNYTYLNFLKLPNQIILPTYGDTKMDSQAIAKLQNLFAKPVYGIKANKLADEGGMINCISWCK